jgi:hypothetical protein
MAKCAACSSVAPSSLQLDIPGHRPVLAFNIDGRAAAQVAIPDVIPIGPQYRLVATVDWAGSAHVITHVRERRFGAAWRRYDDRDVADVARPLSTGMHEGPFKLAFHTPSAPGVGGHRPSMAGATLCALSFWNTARPLDIRGPVLTRTLMFPTV